MHVNNLHINYFLHVKNFATSRMRPVVMLFPTPTAHMVKIFALLSNKLYKVMNFIDRKLFGINVAYINTVINKVKEFTGLLQGSKICNLRTPVNL